MHCENVPAIILQFTDVIARPQYHTICKFSGTYERRQPNIRRILKNCIRKKTNKKRLHSKMEVLTLSDVYPTFFS